MILSLLYFMIKILVTWSYHYCIARKFNSEVWRLKLTTKLKSANIISHNEIVHAVALLVLSGTPPSTQVLHVAISVLARRQIYFL